MALGSYLTKTPAIIPSLVGWFDASDLSTITSGGGTASAIRNMANSLNSFSQPTATNQPATGVNNINGRNVLTFDGVDNYMTSASAFMNPTTSGGTVLMVVQPQTTATLQIYLNQAGTNVAAYLRNQAGAIPQSAIGGVNSSSTTFSNGSNYIFGVRFPTSGTLDILVNSITTSFSSITVGTSTSIFYLGSTSAPSNYSSIYFGELLIYSRNLSNDELLTAQRYLGNKWGISAP